MYRPLPQRPNDPSRDEETVIALDEESGRTLWEHRYAAAPLDFQYGACPHATPLIVGDRIFTAGTNKQIYALDKRAGRVLWHHDLVKEFGAPPTLMRTPVKAGDSCSPLAYRDTVILTAGGPGRAVMAFDQRDGAVRWQSQDGHISHASPILISLDGQEQLVVVSGTDVKGLNPATGALIWSHPHETRMDMNISTRVWSDDHMLLVSSAYDHGTRMLHVTRAGAETTAREVWFSRRMRVHIGTIIRIGDFAPRAARHSPCDVVERPPVVNRSVHVLNPQFT
jgi:outer membrane protein assembly factor BamB